MKRLLILAVLMALIPTEVSRSDDSANLKVAARKMEIDQFAQEILDAWKLPGLAIGIVEKNQVVYTGGFGVMNLETGGPITPRTLFHMASVSKPFVATAIMQLVERGKLNFDDKVVTYLPYFRLADERYKEITIRQMLAHTSGMPDVHDYEWDNPQYDAGALERYVRSLTEETLIAAPGDSTRYSNMAFEVLGDLISKVSGMSFADYQKKQIFGPLGMNLSTFLYEMPPELEATGHIRPLKVEVSDVYPYNRAHGPSSTLHSNVLEMCNWAIANLNRGILNRKRILQESSYDEMWTPIVRVGPNMERGLSWFLTEHDGKRMVFHSGGDVGFRSNLVLLPDDSLAVVVMCNQSGSPVPSITNALVDVALGKALEPLPAPIIYPMMEIIADDGVDAAVAYFHKMRADTAVNYAFHEAYLNNLGYRLIGMERLSDAKAVLRANIEAYPDAFNTYDSYAEVCMLVGDREEAIANYRKSLELNPENTNAVEMLKELEG